MNANDKTLAKVVAFDGSTWTGSAELWVDPLGHEASRSDATLRFAADTLKYTWSHEGKAQTGEFQVGPDQIMWVDTWHQPEPTACHHTGNPRGLFSVEYDYPAGPGPEWSWRIALAQRPDQTLVLQMTNITPWGEEGRAVRMIFSPDAESASP